ncbi:hypothetical protein YC2023_018065 [Brassica napus]
MIAGKNRTPEEPEETRGISAFHPLKQGLLERFLFMDDSFVSVRRNSNEIKKLLTLFSCMLSVTFGDDVPVDKWGN